jgi:hypothetical protein
VLHDGGNVRDVEFDRLGKAILGHEGSRLSAQNFGLMVGGASRELEVGGGTEKVG